MFKQKVIIDGDAFMMTLPKMYEHRQFLEILKTKYPDAFNKNRFHSVVQHDQGEDFLLYCTKQREMQYSGVLYEENGDFHIINDWVKVGLTVFPKLIPLDRLDRPYRLDPNDYPDGTITTGGTASVYKNDWRKQAPHSGYYSIWNSKKKPAMWGDHFTLDHTQVIQGTMSWMVMDGLLFAVTAAWRMKPEDMLESFTWDFEGEALFCKNKEEMD